MKISPSRGKGEPDGSASPGGTSSPDEQTARRFERLLQRPAEGQRSANHGGSAQKQVVPASYPAKVRQTGESFPTGEAVAARASGQSRKDEWRHGQDIPDDKRRDGRDDGEQARALPGDRILAAMGGSEPEPVQKARGSGWELGDLAQKLAGRILVAAEAGDSTSREVRIRLKDSVLPGTEIVLRRKRGGVEIRFQASDTDALRLLNTHLDDLRQALDARLGDRMPVSLSVSTTDAGEGRPEDGRSRNRREFDEEWDSDDT